MFCISFSAGYYQADMKMLRLIINNVNKIWKHILFLMGWCTQKWRFHGCIIWKFRNKTALIKIQNLFSLGERWVKSKKISHSYSDCCLPNSLVETLSNDGIQADKLVAFSLSCRLRIARSWRKQTGYFYKALFFMDNGYSSNMFVWNYDDSMVAYFF